MTGTIYFIGGVLGFTIIHAIQKHLVMIYPIEIVLLYRFGTATLLAPIVFPRCPLPRINDLLPLLLNSLFVLATITTIVISLKYLPLGRVTILTNVAPIFVVLLAPGLLREPVTLWHLLIVLFGFVGVLLVNSDRQLGFSWVDKWPLLAAFFYALVLITGRRLTFGASALATSIHINLLISLLLVPVMLIRGKWSMAPAIDHPTSILALGTLTWLSEWLTLYGLQRLPTATAAPLDYLSIVFGLTIGYLVWAEVPGWMVLIGAMMIATSGMAASRLD
jgi:drug/metabolite transporter (DMT)-like permease